MHADRRSTTLAGLDPARLGLVAGGFGAVLALLVVFGAIAEDVREQEVMALDAIVTPLLHALASPGLDALMQLMTDLGSLIVVGPLFVLAMAWLLWTHRPRLALFLAVAIGGSVVLNETLKLIFQRPRPQLPWATAVPAGYSFPSGHAMNSLVFYGALALIAWSVWGRRAGLVSVAVALVIALLVGTSRIYFGYHYVSDVVAGWLAGAAWLLLLALAFDLVPDVRGWRAGAAPSASPPSPPGQPISPSGSDGSGLAAEGAAVIPETGPSNSPGRSR